MPLIRHVTPGLGVLPRDTNVDACSGLVGVALGTAQVQADSGHRTQVFGWNPESATDRWKIGSVEAFATRGWTWAKLGPYDFRVVGPMLHMGRRTGTPDVLHAYTDPHLLLASGAPIRLFHLQTPVPNEPSRSYSYLVNKADAVVCCSHFIRNQFLNSLDYPESRVYEVPNGIDPGRFLHLDRERVRASWGVEHRTPVLLFAGALVPEKGLIYLLRAVRELLSRFSFHLVVAGSSALWLTPEHGTNEKEDDYSIAIREAARGLPVTWLGSVSVAEMPHVYSASDVFVCPSAWDEPFGMVTCEAMAAGKPVVASRRGGLIQIVEDGETGLLIPSEDVDALTNALATLLSNPHLAERMGRSARERSSLFSWSRIASKLDEIYAELSSNSPLREARITPAAVEHKLDGRNQGGEIS
jgi:glycosyltransferase involved in cell wall biosynthesis